MRITLTAPVLDGGIGRHVVNLAAAWLDCGVAVDLVIDRRRGTLLDDLPAAVDLFVSGGSHPIARLPWLVRYLRRRQPDALLTSVPRHTLWALRARRLSGRSPVIVANVHNNYVMTLSAVRTTKRRSRIALLRRHYPRCDAIVPVSRGASAAFSHLTGIPEARLTPLPNPVVTPALIEMATQPVDHPWFVGDGPPVVIWVGRLEPQKNVGLLLQAFNCLRAHRWCRLVIVGDGSQRDALVRQAGTSPYGDDIAFLGHRRNPHGLVHRASVLALSSSWEGFGNVLVEAMALGTPVAAVDCPSGPAEILENGRWGPLAPVDDAEALATNIDRCIREPVPAETLKQAAAEYHADRVAGRYLELIQGLRTD